MSFTFHLFDSISQDIKSEGKDSYTICLFGSSPQGTPVKVEVTGFEPFFYIQLPQTKRAFGDFLDRMNEEVQAAGIRSNTVRYEECSKKSMYGYSGGKSLSLVKISTQSRKAFYSMKKLFLDERSRPKFVLYHDSDPVKVFDAGLDPMLRFFHLRNLQPCGWITIPTEVDEEEGIHLSCDWEDISPCGKPPMASAPFKINFWDIECYSASGDFPVASRGDPVIQIGNVIVQQGKPTKRVIFVVGSLSLIHI